MYEKRAIFSILLLVCFVAIFLFRQRPSNDTKDSNIKRLYLEPSDLTEDDRWEKSLLRFYAREFFNRDPNWKAKPARASAEIVDWPLHRNVTVIADVHGDFEVTVQLLNAVGIIDTTGRWTYGDNILWMLGDFCDRGHNSPPIFELLWRLQEQAETAFRIGGTDEAYLEGGKVIQLLGNHEVMNMFDYTAYVSTKERSKYYNQHPANPHNQNLSSHRELWNPKSGYLGANILRSFYAAYQIGDLIGVHGGLLRPYSSVKTMFDLTTSNQQMILKGEQDKIFRGEGPYMTRILSQAPEYEACPILNEALTDRHATTQVVGHTPTRKPGLVEFRCDQRYIMLDTRNSRQMGGDKPTAIEIRVDLQSAAVRGSVTTYQRYWEAVQITDLRKRKKSRTVIKEDVVCYTNGRQIRPCPSFEEGIDL